MTPPNKVALVGTALSLLLLSSVTQAAWISIQLDYNQFGHLANSGDRCAPTATVNSFQYLQNRYGAAAGNLIPGAGTDLESARDKLATGWTNSNGDLRTGSGGCGASAKSWWEAKAYWVQDFGTSHVKLDGQVKIDGGAKPFADWFRGDVLEDKFPEWTFLWGEIADGEDIELGFRFSGGAHAVTLTSLKFDDANGDSIWNAGEARKLDYLDPNAPGSLIEADLTLLGSGALGFRWNNGSNPAVDVFIDLAYTESVPEPGALALVALGLALMRRSARRVMPMKVVALA